MSPYLFSADFGATDLGKKARANTLVPTPVMSISDLFTEYAAAVARGDRARVAEIRLAGGPSLRAELDGFDYPATA